MININKGFGSSLFRTDFLLCVALFLAAAFTGFAAPVEVKLIAQSETVSPGGNLRAGLQIKHSEHWHSYWLNPGTGLPTKLTLDLPAGWSASPLEWPVPGIITDATGAVVGQGYEGTVVIPFTLKAPDTLESGASVLLRGRATWLMCSESCVPGDARVVLRLKVGESEAAANAKASPDSSAIAAVNLPQPKPDWSCEAVSSASGIELRIKGAPQLHDAHFFTLDDTVRFDTPQAVSVDSGIAVLTLQTETRAQVGVARLRGVLAWNDEKGQRKGANLDLPLLAAAADTQGAGTDGSKGSGATLLGTLLLAFVGGIILNLMPCVFPVLGIKIMGFVNQAGADRRRVTMHGLVFTGGVMMSFWSLAAALALLRAGGSRLGWGFQLQSPVFVLLLAAVMLVFAMSMSGVFEFGLRASGVGSGLQMKEGYAGSFFTGILATVVATPCSAPFLAPALGAALALPLSQSFLVFSAIGLGLSLPYLLLSLFPAAVRMLPRPGAWMETFRQFMAFPLYATVGYLLWVLAGQLTDSAYLNSLLGLCLIALGTWCYGRFCAPGAKPGRLRFGYASAFVCAVAGLWLAWPVSAKANDLVWEAWSQESLAKAQAAGKTVYVDFTARWCATCQANKKLVFGSEEVKAKLREKGVVLLRADWTNSDPIITAELEKWKRSAVPFNLIYRPGQAPRVLPELLNAGIVLKALED
jgi:thiol:disulfide interchange protein DsbD